MTPACSPSAFLRGSGALPVAAAALLGIACTAGAPAAAAATSTFAPGSTTTGTAALLLSTPGTGASWTYPGTASASSDVTAAVGSDKPQTGGGTYVSVVGRQVSSTADYRVKVRYRADGGVTAWLVRDAYGVETALASTTVAGLVSSQQSRVRLSVEGTGTTTLRAKVWAASAPEPAAWTLTASDTASALQAPGRVALLGYLSASSTSAPETVAVSGLSVVSAVPVVTGAVADGSATSSTSATFSFTAPRTDLTFACALDGGVAAACASPVSWAGLADGAHSLVVWGVDAAGTSTGAASRTWRVDATAPETGLTRLPGTDPTSAAFSLASTEAGSFSCRTDAAAWAPCTSPTTLSGLLPGSHQLDVRATDSVGNVDASPATSTWTVAAPAPAPTTSPAPAPAPAGTRPGAGNTGVPVGTTLTPHWGDLTITTAGTHLDAMDLHGFLSIKAPDVTVTRSIIRGGVATVQKALVQSTGARTVISDSTLLPEAPSVYIDGLKGYGFTATRLDISGTVDTALIYGNDSTIQDSWLHDNRHYLVDPAQGGTPSHDDGIQVQGGTTIRLRNNSVPGGWNSAVQVTQDYAVTSDLQISGNWFGGGGCTVNIAEKARGPIQGLVLNANRFDHTSRLDCAVILPTTTPMSAWDDLWSDTLTPVRIRYN